MNIYRIFLISLCLFFSRFIYSETLKFECVQTNLPFCQYVKTEFEKQSIHKIEIVILPTPTDDRLRIFQRLFAARDGQSVDVFQADIIWMGLIHKHLLDLTPFVSDVKSKFFPIAWEHNVFGGKTKGVPASLDAGMLFYRADLLTKYHEKVPETWAELTRIATKIQTEERANNQNEFWGYIFQANNYEGLYCNALEWINSSHGGNLIDHDGNIIIKPQETQSALEMASEWIGNITPRETLGFFEEESRQFFQNGHALFMRNWPYAYVLAQSSESKVKGKIGVAPLPKFGDEGMHAATLGGWQWVINKYTEHPEASVELLRFLIDAKTQKAQFKIGGVAPSRIDVYNDPEVTTIAPYLKDFKTVFFTALPRVSNETKNKYPEVSKIISDTVYDVLTGRIDSSTAIQQLEQRLTKIKGNDW